MLFLLLTVILCGCFQMFLKGFSLALFGDSAELQRNRGGGRRDQKCFQWQMEGQSFGFRKLLEGIGKPPDLPLLLTQILVEIPLSLTLLRQQYRFCLRGKEILDSMTGSGAFLLYPAPHQKRWFNAQAFELPVLGLSLLAG